VTVALRLPLLIALLAALPLWAGANEATVPLPRPKAAMADHVIYRIAIESFDARRYDRGLALAHRGNNPLLDKVVRWLDLRRRSTPASYAELTDFIARNPDWPDLGTLRRNAETVMPAGLTDHELLAWFEGHEPRTTGGAVRLAEALRRGGDEARAVALLRKTWIEGGFGTDEERAFRNRYRTLLRRADHIARLDRLLWRGSSSAARRQAWRIGEDYARLAEARILLRAGNPGVDYAVKHLPKHLADDPGFLYDRARWRQRKGRAEGVVELIDALPPDPPKPELWWRLRRWAARRAMAEGDYETAYRVASSHGLDDGTDFAEAEWLAGWIAFRFLARPAAAQGHFQHLRERVSSPISMARGAYWLGEALAAQNKGQDAARWYKAAAEHGETFYGQLANSRISGVLKLDLRPGKAPTAEETARFERREIVRVVALLGEIQATKLQDRFFRTLQGAAEDASDYRLIAGLARRVGRPDQALLTAKRARRTQIWMGDELFPLAAPRSTGSAPDGLEEALVLALIRQESGFYSAAVSPAGARGLMQLMPGTARQVAKGLGLPYRKGDLTENPAYNMRLGRAYLAEMLERFDGSLILALAAYNAGPHRVNRWLRDHGDPRRAGVDPIHWAERIPFSETRNYVQRILESLVVYRHRLTGAQTPVQLTPVNLGALP
jgi:soluble lytic murein transglycosylase